ncbi:hypothetical protein D3C72_1668700 [compost metagenome]
MQRAVGLPLRIGHRRPQADLAHDEFVDQQRIALLARLLDLGLHGADGRQRLRRVGRHRHALQLRRQLGLA